MRRRDRQRETLEPARPVQAGGQPGGEGLPPAFSLLLFALVCGPLLFLLNLIPYLNLPLVHHWREGYGLPEWAEFWIYLHGWPTCIVGAGFICWLVRRFAKGLRPATAALYRTWLVMGNAVVCVAGISALWFLRGKDEMVGVSGATGLREAGKAWAQPGTIILCYAGLFLGWNLLLGLGCRIVQKWFEGTAWARDLILRVSRGLCWLLPFLAAIPLAFLFGPPPYRAITATPYYKEAFATLVQPPVYKWALLGVGLAGFLGVTYATIRPRSLPRWLMRASEAAALLAVCLLLIDTTFQSDMYHGNVYLSTVNAAMYGRFVPNQVNTLYGVGLTYTLVGLFSSGLLPFSYAGLSAVNSLALVGMFLMLYSTVRVATGARIPAFVAGLGAALWPYHSHYILTSTYRPTAIAQGPPLRILLTSALVLMVALRTSRADRRTRWDLFALEGACVAFASMWSLETAIYTLGTYAAVVLYEMIGAEPRMSWRETGRRFAITGGIMFVAHAVFAVFSLVRCGEWPAWGGYVRYALFTSATSGPVAPWGAWQVVVFVLYAFAMWAVIAALRWFGRPSPVMPLVVALVAMGALHFTYFLAFSLGVRVGYVLYAPMCLAGIGAALALQRWREGGVAGWFAYGVNYWFFVAALAPVVLFGFKPAEVNPYNYSLLKDVLKSPVEPRRLAVAWENLWHEKPRYHLTAETLALVQKYAPGRKRLGLFVDEIGYTATEVYIHTGTSHAFPIGSAEHDGFAPQSREKILRYAHRLKAGDVVFVAADLKPGLFAELVARLRVEFDFELLETSPQRVQAFRLRAR